MVLPVMDHEQLAAFLAGCGLPHENILIIDNADYAAIPRACPGWDGRMLRPERNLGVAPSWNIGVRAVIAEQLDWLVIASTSFRFGPSGGRTFIDALDGCDLPGAQSIYGWHFIAIARPTFETVGEFDEGFWPAYWEETDFLYRMHLAGLASPRDNGRPWCHFDVDGDYGRQAATLEDGLAPVNLLAVGMYYERKWGGPQGEERFTLPFGNPALPLTWTQQNGHLHNGVASG